MFRYSCIFRNTIYKTRNTRTVKTPPKFRRMLKKIPRNIKKHSGECPKRFRGVSRRFQRMFRKFPGRSKKVSGNIQKHFGEVLERLRRMLGKIPGNVWKDSRECSKRFWGIFKKFPGKIGNFETINYLETLNKT